MSIATGTQKKVKMGFGGGRTATFTAGGRKRYVVEGDMVLVNATIKFADGTVYDGLVELDESSSGENWGIYVFLTDMRGNVYATTHQSDEDFLKKLRKTKKKAFPYQYNYWPVEVNCEDIHVDEDSGWSGA